MKSFCVYHPDEYITNFCRQKNCLLPLCPSCISDHTDFHSDHGTKPQYANILEVTADVHTQINNYIYCLEQDKNRNGNLLLEIRTLPDKIREKVQGAKNIIIKKMDEAFYHLQKQLNATYEKLHEQSKVYSQNMAEKYDEGILKHLDELYSLKNNLKGEKALSSIIYYLKEKQLDVSSFHSHVTSYLHSNQNYEFSLDINSDAIYSIGAVVSRLLQPNIKLGRNTDRSSRYEKSQVIVQHTGGKRAVYEYDKTGSGLKEGRSNVSPLRTRSRMDLSPRRVYEKYENMDYDNLSRRVTQMREENEKLSKYLRMG